MRQHVRYVFTGVTLTVMMVTGCAAQSGTNNSETPQNSTTNLVKTNPSKIQSTTLGNSTQPTNSTVPNGIMTPESTDTFPMEIDAIPGGMLSRQTWPLVGANPNNVGTGMFESNYATTGFTIGGVHWTWPPSDTNSKDYIVVPTTIRNKPYLVWCHLAPQKKLGQPENGSGGYAPNQLEPIGPSQMWITPWTTTGGSLQNHATLITNDIPAVWAVGKWAFPATRDNLNPKSLAGGAWTGWFQWGSVSHPFIVPAATPPEQPTVAAPTGLYPAYDGVVLAVRTQVLGANQGGATNLYYLNLSSRHIEGLASLTGGGGLFSSMRVVSGMVFTGAATDLTGTGNVNAAAYVYDEVTGQRMPVESSAVMSQNNGFDDWIIHGSKIYDANNKLEADLNLPASVVLEPSSSTFGVATS